MRTVTTAESNLLGKAERGTRARLKINRGGTWVDMSDLEGRDWVKEISVKDDVDSPVATMKAVLQKAQFFLNLSPLMDDSKLNAAGVLADLNKQVIVEFATFPIDSEPVSGDWKEVFRGTIHTVDFAKDDVVIEARDQGGVLQDLWIETQKVYGAASGVRVELVMQDILDDNNSELDVIAANFTWNGTITVTMSDTSEVSVGDYIGYHDAPFFKVTSIVPNTSVTITNPSARSIPSGSGPGYSVLIPGVYRVTLYTENGTASDPLYYNAGGWNDSPNWAVKSFKQKRARALTALQELVDQIGWIVKYKWHSGLGAFALYLYEPDRAKTTPDRSFSEDQILNVSQLSLSLADIRNKVRVTYGIVDDRTSVYKENTASQTKYGLRAMDISEASSSQIDSSTEANAMAQAVVDDLSEPTAIASFELPLFWAAEVGDLYRWLANSRYFDSNQDLAVTGIQHKISSRGGNRTIVNVRGKPSGGRKRWLGLETLPGLAWPVDALGDSAASNVVAENSMGGIVITYDDPRTMDPPITDWVLTRCYVSTTSGFTPGASNLRGAGRQTRFEIGGLVPGTVYYAKLEIIDASGNVSTISAQITATALRVGPYHTNNATQPDTLIRNADFGVYTLEDAAPDFWYARGYTGIGCTGIWYGDTAPGSGSYIIREAADGSTGGYLLKLGYDNSPGYPPYLQSERFPVTGNDLYFFGATFKGTGTDEDLLVQVKQYDSGGSLVATDTVTIAIGTGTSWQSADSGVLLTDADAVEAELVVYLDGSAYDVSCYIDKVWVNRGLDFIHGYLSSSYAYTTTSGIVTINTSAPSDDNLRASVGNIVLPGLYLLNARAIITSAFSSITFTLEIEADTGSGYATVWSETKTVAYNGEMRISCAKELLFGDAVRLRFSANQNCNVVAGSATSFSGTGLWEQQQWRPT